MKIFSILLKKLLTTSEVALMTDEYHCQDLKEQEDDLNISSRRSSEKVSCGTRSRPSGC